MIFHSFIKMQYKMLIMMKPRNFHVISQNGKVSINSFLMIGTKRF